LLALLLPRCKFFQVNIVTLLVFINIFVIILVFIFIILCTLLGLYCRLEKQWICLHQLSVGFLLALD
jgi:hypothetical protein